jgi:very-short-patch-repair endonuclease
MTRLTRLPDPLTLVPFRVDQGRSLGVSNDRLARRDLQRPFHGVRSATPVHPIQAYLPLLASHQFFSHVSAAQLHGMRLPRRFEMAQDVHVAVTAPDRLPRRVNVVGHQVRPHESDLVAVRGYRTVSAITAWIQLAPLLKLDELIVAGDGLMCRKSPLTTLDAIRDRIGELSGVHGVPILRRALVDLRSRTDSARETLLRLAIVRAGLPEPEVNGRIDDDFGRFIAFGDLVYRRWKVIAEYDGEQHRLDEAQYLRDVDRLHALAEAGWTVIRLNKSHLVGPSREATARVRRALEAAGWRG